MIQRIGHINIQTDRLEETMRFYEALFDLVPSEPPMTLSSPTVWLFDRDGRALIHLSTPMAGKPAARGEGALNHVALDCADLPRMKARLDAHGVHFQEFSAVEGMVQLFLMDPNGARLELTFGAEQVLRPDLAR